MTEKVWDADDLEAEEANSGLWIVRNKGVALQWNAWRDWLRSEFGRKFFSDTMTVWFEWPPQTEAGAQFVADRIKENRKEINWSKSVPRRPRPWDPHRVAA